MKDKHLNLDIKILQSALDLLKSKEKYFYGPVWFSQEDIETIDDIVTITYLHTCVKDFGTLAEIKIPISEEGMYGAS